MARLLLALLGLMVGQGAAYTLAPIARTRAPVRRTDASSIVMGTSLRTGDMVQVISGSDKVRGMPFAVCGPAAAVTRCHGRRWQAPPPSPA